MFESYTFCAGEPGDVIWEKIFGGSDDDWANPLVQTSDGGYTVAGSTESKGSGGRDFWLLKLGGQGNIKKIEKKNQK